MTLVIDWFWALLPIVKVVYKSWGSPGTPLSPKATPFIVDTSMFLVKTAGQLTVNGPSPLSETGRVSAGDCSYKLIRMDYFH